VNERGSEMKIANGAKKQGQKRNQKCKCDNLKLYRSPRRE
jgi:hypothetical protein